jgi:hypothetical protein
VELAPPGCTDTEQWSYATNLLAYVGPHPLIIGQPGRLAWALASEYRQLATFFLDWHSNEPAFRQWENDLLHHKVNVQCSYPEPQGWLERLKSALSSGKRA